MLQNFFYQTAIVAGLLAASGTAGQAASMTPNPGELSETVENRCFSHTQSTCGRILLLVQQTKYKVKNGKHIRKIKRKGCKITEKWDENNYKIKVKCQGGKRPPPDLFQ
ncbi:hypothetical protein N181_27620 [Sinorhizobium fredii USDA 205]|uniref:Uncharacterized protein n=1 Tax=Rhizobium fredii TaxID=380 RepID=A0A844AD91_RHIFR|nr:hypothetical protein [Sinorhizobium fredii]KSV82004.1 hypothetical protein N181_27620 [Sinorhizobium fredii USDA 205]MQX09616.1 hypothetical protein [Sinorhizobium fredii]GEC35383.1 hypothetical protein EFR01_55540 [Sinorhizobium fredii]GLS08524.1 hypothetical protein GCM10007864_21530 [Sinorhizobium fredii]